MHSETGVTPIVTADDAPTRMNGMVSGVRAGGFVFLSAIRGRDPQTNGFSPDPLTQARRSLANLEAVLRGEGLSLRSVVKVTLYLHDLELRDQFHQAWLETFGDHPPARTAVGVADAGAKPNSGALYALDVIALDKTV